MRYHYVFMSQWDHLNEVIYGDILHLENVEFLEAPANNWSIKLMKLLPNLLKFLWNKKFYNKKIDGPICFVFRMSSMMKGREPLFRYLKKRYKGCKFVAYLGDVIASRPYADLSLLDKYFDLVFSFDQGDCEKYSEHHLLYFPTMYSKQEIPDSSAFAESDVFFCGKAKDRYECIAEIYKRLTASNIRCDFSVSRLNNGVHLVDGINYIDKMEYKEYLQRLDKSKCLLDVLQGESRGFTLRVWEALVYGKKLITTNSEILNAPFYDARQFLYISSPEILDVSFVTQNFQPEPRYISEVSPMKFLQFLENNL